MLIEKLLKNYSTRSNFDCIQMMFGLFYTLYYFRLFYRESLVKGQILEHIRTQVFGRKL